MIEIFKTNIAEKQWAIAVINELEKEFPQLRMNIDLHDCDKVLRVEGSCIACNEIINLVSDCGFHCSLLEG